MPKVVIIHGAAKGADSLADQYGVVNWCPIEEYPADWKRHGNAAGPIRNSIMLEVGRPNLVVAFPDKSSRGTWDMIRKAEASGVEVIVVHPQ